MCEPGESRFCFFTDEFEDIVSSNDITIMAEMWLDGTKEGVSKLSDTHSSQRNPDSQTHWYEQLLQFLKFVQTR
jgi:hypothetical protein